MLEAVFLVLVINTPAKYGNNTLEFIPMQSIEHCESFKDEISNIYDEKITVTGNWVPNTQAKGGGPITKAEKTVTVYASSVYVKHAECKVLTK